MNLSDPHFRFGTVRLEFAITEFALHFHECALLEARGLFPEPAAAANNEENSRQVENGVELILPSSSLLKKARRIHRLLRSFTWA